ncbi:MAG TPA: choice-of-anchor D domain-containing protein [Vicinamibacterales bacterium]
MQRQRLGIVAIVLGVSGGAVLPGCGNTSANTSAVVPSSPSTVHLNVSVDVSSPSQFVAIGTVQQFTATVSSSAGGPVSQLVVWSVVSGSGCSGAGCGTIDATGKYTAPATVPNPRFVGVSATSGDATGVAVIIIVDYPGESYTYAISPANLATFGNQLLNTPSTPIALTVTNTGTVPQSVFVRIDGMPGVWQNFTQTNDCPSTMAAGASCTVKVTFTPSATGFRTASFIVDGLFEEEAVLTLSGTGTTTATSGSRD